MNRKFLNYPIIDCKPSLLKKSILINSLWKMTFYVKEICHLKTGWTDSTKKRLKC
jgi:hypothetical protein